MTYPNSIQVNPEWLAACGMQRYTDVWLTVTRVDDHGPGRIMYHVELPLTLGTSRYNGGSRPWVVWEARGVIFRDDSDHALK